MQPLLYIAPRGLITILLFLTILPEQTIALPDQTILVNKSLIIQVIVLSVIVMMIGLMINKKELEVPHAKVENPYL